MYCGLNNLGNTCYMNSLLQTLFMTRQFREALFKWKYDETKHPKKEDCIPYQLQYLFTKMQEGYENRAVDARGLVRSFQWDPQESFAQHDVQEFCRVLFDAIQQSDDQDFITRLYQSHSQSYVQCLKCQSESVSNEVFLDLSLTVKSDFLNVYNESLERALYYYIKPEKLDGDNKYFCQNCNDKTDALKGFRLKALSDILTIQLNRFELDMNTFERKKVNDYVSFPFVLDMNNFLKPYDQILIEDHPDLLEERERLKIQYEQEKSQGCFSDPLRRKNRKPSPDERVQKVHFDDTPQIVQPDDKAQFKKQLLEAHQEFQQKFQSLKSNNTSSTQFTSQTIPNNPNLILTADEAYDIDSDMLFGNNLDNLGDLGEGTTANTVKALKEVQGSAKTQNYEEKEIQERIENESHNLSVKQKIQELLQNGPNVYELYSVMIHSGGALGGHYYAYVKSFENGDWYCFNDSTVSKISWKTILSMFGDKYPKYNMGSSAYFLMYRRAGEELSTQKPQIQEHLKEAIAKEIQEQKEREEKWEREKKEREMELKIRCFYKSNDVVIKTRKDTLLKDFKLQVRQELNVQEDDENTRIRFYNSNDKIPQETFTNKENETLQCLYFNDYKSVLLETKAPHEQFEEYDPHLMLIKLCVWRNDIESLDESELKPLKFFIRDDKTVDQFMDAITQRLGVPKDKQIILQKNWINGATNYSIRINQQYQLEFTLYDLKIGRNVTLYLEEKQDDANLPLNWDQKFECEKHKCRVTFNDPRKNLLPLESPDYCFELQIDNRKTMKELKEKMSDFLGIDIDSFIVKKSNRYGEEIKDLSTTIKNNQAIGRAAFCLMMGKPSTKGVYKIKVGMGGISQKYSDTIDFEYQDLFEMEINSEWYVKELKEKLCQKVEETKQITLQPNLIRLRYKVNTKLSQVYHNDQLLKNLRLFDNQTIVIEKLEKEDEIKENQLLGYVRFYNPKDFTLSFPPSEIFLNSTDTMHDTSVVISNLFNINQDAIEAIKINNIFSFTITDLVTASFDWQLLKFNENVVSKGPWFLLKDSYFIIVRDAREVPKDMTELRQKVDEILAKSSDPAKIQQKIPMQSIKPKEKALKITVVKKQDEQQKSEEQQKQEELQKQEDEQQGNQQPKEDQLENKGGIQENTNETSKDEQKD
ncbi:unnamed protein product (macronuclear) [Paramecium tetraurelia]|uniref:USP domain-containing protein n=1 Tax=Paramecium tetraurelia TaxID=5888 RepID=A0BTY8_PARTE|nr:uncharacterized protein GSPATT00032237001 [Paramecium tetraurelia]CAK62005.1 unnamed protein product [Paramecium tetraurelia]|eukprot:XP_001429403.1 hypothetical protein (macronuclear) [Paramecium tetraurelia strain d4-2]